MSADKVRESDPVTVRCAERVRENSVVGIRTANSQTLRKESTRVCMRSVLVEKGAYWVAVANCSLEEFIFSFTWFVVDFGRIRWRIQSYDNERVKAREVKASKKATIVRTIDTSLMSFISNTIVVPVRCASLLRVFSN